MTTNTHTIDGLKNNVEGLVIKLQTDAKNEFEQQTEKVQSEIENLDEDDIEQFVSDKFNKLNTLFLKKSKKVEKFVLSKRPKKPVRTAEETDEEYNQKYKVYEESLGLYKSFVSWSMSMVERLMHWLSELFDDIISFFKNLWTWIKSKIRDISTNVREFVAKIAEKFSRLHDYLFGENNS
ncbi:1430_t:CDS:2 [Ambispora leptoticha]|uniref:1430_t:CDS:1 n=1 Tax=Ambispora leptoticha TaxID=144679 RepID=A0A9N9AVE8_9GLOM|nr:1430_t:CDS:2 [Ambispora leptoticha]